MPRITGQSPNDVATGGTATKERAPAKQPRTKAKRNEKAAREYFDAFNAHDLDAMAAFWDDETIEDLVPVGILRGPGELREYFGSMFAALPDVQMTIERVVADASVATVQWRMAGTFTGGPFMGLEANGKYVDMRGCDLIEFEERTLRRNTVFFDSFEFARAVGMLPPRDSGAERAMFSAFNAVTKVRSRLNARSAAQ
jgi:steroid delta-isomerase-like uncharacterized protein